MDLGEAAPAPAAATVETVSSGTQRRLQQIETLINSEAWDEAFDVLADLLSERSNELVLLPGDVFVPLRTHCQMLIAKLPPEALAIYRRRVDDVASGWLNEGTSQRNEQLLRRIVDELSCSSSGDEALYALGELALERGDIGAARGLWESIHPGLRGPAGQPLALLVQNVDLAANATAVREYLSGSTQPTGFWAYPDSDLALSDVLAKLIVASIRERNLEQAERELELLKLLDPQARGRLAGSEVDYVAALSEMIASAKSWPESRPHADWTTFAGDATRSTTATAVGQLTGVVWELPLAPQPTFVPRVPFQIINGRPVAQATPFDSTDETSTTFPLVHDHIVLIRDAEKVRAVSLETGKPAITRSGILLQEQQSENEASADLVRRLDVFNGQIRGGRVASRPTSMTVCDETLFAFAPPEEALTDVARTAARASDRIVGLDLRRDGLLSVELEPDDGGWRFSGPPACSGGRIYVPMRREEVQPQLFVACYSAATGRRLWRTSICSTQPINDFGVEQPSSDLLTLAGGAVFFNTNAGIVAALEQHDGQVRWLRRYARGGMGADNNRAVSVNRRDVPCLYHRGVLVVASADAASVFALDSTTGAALWNNDEAYDVEHLVGAVDGTLVASGRRFWMLDIATGAIHERWPDSIGAGIRGTGRGCVAGSEVFWPTETAIYVFDLKTGAQSRLPIELAPLGVNSVNLVAAQGFLLLAGNEKLVALGSEDRQPALEPQLSSIPSSYHFAHE